MQTDQRRVDGARLLRMLEAARAVQYQVAALVERRLQHVGEHHGALGDDLVHQRPLRLFLQEDAEGVGVRPKVVEILHVEVDVDRDRAGGRHLHGHERGAERRPLEPRRPDAIAQPRAPVVHHGDDAHLGLGAGQLRQRLHLGDVQVADARHASLRRRAAKAGGVRLNLLDTLEPLTV